MMAKCSTSPLRLYTVVELRKHIKKQKLFTKKEIHGLSRWRRDTLEEFLTKTRSKVGVKIKKFVMKHLHSWFQRKCSRIRNPGFANRDKCNNYDDFYTMQPLKDIPYELFFAFKDEAGFWYGFNVLSLARLITDFEPINPYNRASLPLSIQRNVITLARLINILLPPQKEEREIQQRGNTESLPNTRNDRFLGMRLYPRHSTSLGYHLIAVLSTLREQSINTRIEELFIEVDRLGNYTSSRWFHLLSRQQYIQLYDSLYAEWHISNSLSLGVKYQICHIGGDPFFNICVTDMEMELDRDTMQEACLLVAENLVFTGVDLEMRKLGAIHFLMHLAKVSESAHQFMPWLVS